MPSIRKAKLRQGKRKKRAGEKGKRKVSVQPLNSFVKKCYLFIARQLTLSKFIKMTDKEHRKGPIFHLMLGQ